MSFWLLIVAGTAYVMGSSGEPNLFQTLDLCKAEAAQMLAYEAGKRHVGIAQLDMPMQCYSVNAEYSVSRRYAGGFEVWQQRPLIESPPPQTLFR